MSKLNKEIKSLPVSSLGILNLGNTCFLNACIQVLNYTFELPDILENSHIHDNLDGLIIKEWFEIRNLMWSSEKFEVGANLNPSKFIHTIQHVAKEKNRELFTGWSQNDFSEFLLFLIECFHNGISRTLNINVTGNIHNITDKFAFKCFEMLQEVYKKEYSDIMKYFYGIYVSVITPINKPNEQIIKPELFFLLDLPIPAGVSPTSNKPFTDIYDCFDLFCQKEYVQGENAWFNENTGQKENISKQIQFWSLPNILIITFQRFSFDGVTKNNTFINFPLNNLDLSKYIVGYDKETYVYQLYGVCNHYGSISMGHYTSIVRTSNIRSKYTTYDENAQTNWTFFNDCDIKTFTKNANESTINNQTDDLDKTARLYQTRHSNLHDVVTLNAYCLFYRKIE